MLEATPIKKDRWFQAASFSIIAAALAFRLWKLSGKSLWLDEALSLMLIRGPVQQILTNTVETNSPFYYLLLHVWVGLFGTSEAAMRSLSVIFGTTAVLLMGWLGHILGGRRMAILSMTVMAVTPVHVLWSQTARVYAIYLAFTMASFGCLIYWLRAGSRRWAALYVLSTIIMCYAHYYWVFNLAAQQLYVGYKILRRRVRFLPWAAVTGLVLAGYAPWMVFLMKQTVTIQRKGFWIPPPAWSDLYQTIRGYFFWFESVPRWLFLGYAVLASLGLAAMVLRLNGGQRFMSPAVEGGENADNGEDSKRKAGLLLLWMICPLLIPFIWSRVAQSIFWDRYTITASVPFCLLVARGVLVLPGRIIKGAVTLFLVAVGVIGLHYYYPWQMEDWRSLAVELRRSVREGDVVTVSPEYNGYPLGYYYKDFYTPLPATVDEVPWERVNDAVKQAVRNRRRVYMIFRGQFADPDLLIGSELLRRNPKGKMVTESSFGFLVNLRVYDFRRRRRN